jgi:hypothetical protein
MRQHSRGQVLVIFALSLFALLMVVGLAIDAGSIYITYGELKRAVDASAVSAANNFKRGETVEQMQSAALEILGMHEIDLAKVELQVYICDSDADGLRDELLLEKEPEFYRRCPDTSATGKESPRKLVWVDASMKAPVYFMSLANIESFPLRTNAIAEAAQVDVVIVFDVSESMGAKTEPIDVPPYGYVVDQFDPDDPTYGCNLNNTCKPLKDAKTAAKALVDKLYEGYDQIGLVTFDSQAITQMDLTLLTAANKDTIKTAIDDIKLHDDPSPRRLPGVWQQYMNGSEVQQRYNPVNPEDRDGDGRDIDDPNMYGVAACDQLNGAPWKKTLWDSTINPYGWSGTVLVNGVDTAMTGVPCDLDGVNDTYDWNDNHIWNDEVGDPAVYPDDGTDITDASQTDAALAAAWIAAHDPDDTEPMVASLSPFSTCTGCGLRVASNVFKSKGRPNAVWVMIMLSDGVVNLSDTPQTAGWVSPAPEANYRNGFCQGSIKPIIGSDPVIPWDVFWKTLCIDKDKTPRICIDTSTSTCPPGSVVNQNQYSVLDYAMDMVDEAALTVSENENEILGNNIAIYSIYLDSSSAIAGEYLLRYMADVGDDGDRRTQASCDRDPSLPGRICGQYYHAPNETQLLPIFENIASRIYTRITQ